MSEKLNLGEIVLPNETKHQIYVDGAQPALIETGKFIGRIPRAINAAFAPLDCWILKQENNVARTKQLLEKNLQNADPEKIVPPEPYVAVPAINALSYSMDSDELRKMYANLLTKAIYADTKNSVHPAFTEIIKNLSPLDCKLFNAILSTPGQQIACYEIRFGKSQSSYSILLPYITEFTFDTPEKICASIDNLERNRLISPKDFHYNNDALYEPIRNTYIYKQIMDLPEEKETNRKVIPYKISIKSTYLGQAFYNICSKPLK